MCQPNSRCITNQRQEMSCICAPGFKDKGKGVCLGMSCSAVVRRCLFQIFFAYQLSTNVLTTEEIPVGKLENALLWTATMTVNVPKDGRKPGSLHSVWILTSAVCTIRVWLAIASMLKEATSVIVRRDLSSRTDTVSVRNAFVGTFLHLNTNFDFQISMSALSQILLALQAVAEIWKDRMNAIVHRVIRKTAEVAWVSSGFSERLFLNLFSVFDFFAHFEGKLSEKRFLIEYMFDLFSQKKCVSIARFQLSPSDSL